MTNLFRLVALFSALGIVPFAHAKEELEGTLKCQGSLRGVSLHTTLILKRLIAPRNPNQPDFFPVEMGLDDSEYARNTFTVGAGIPTPNRMKMDFFSCADQTHDPNIRLYCGGYYRAPSQGEGNRARLNPVGVSVNVAYRKDGTITAQAIVTKTEWTNEYDLGRETLYQCVRVLDDQEN